MGWTAVASRSPLSGAARALRSTYCTAAHSKFLRDECDAGATMRAISEDPTGARLSEQDRAVYGFAALIAVDASSIHRGTSIRSVAWGSPMLTSWTSFSRRPPVLFSPVFWMDSGAPTRSPDRGCVRAGHPWVDRGRTSGRSGLPSARDLPRAAPGRFPADKWRSMSPINARLCTVHSQVKINALVQHCRDQCRAHRRVYERVWLAHTTRRSISR